MSDSNLIFITLGLAIWFCFVTCRYLCKNSERPQSEVAALTHTTVFPTTHQQYPQQPSTVPGPSQSYEGVPYQPVPVQLVYPAQPMATMPCHGQPFTPGPPPSYQEATSLANPLQPMPYSQAAFPPNQPVYPLKPPAQPQPSAPPGNTDFLGHSAYNPEFVLS